MADKIKPRNKYDSNQITAEAKSGENETEAIARAVLRPTVQAAVTLKQYGKSYGDLNLSGLIDSLSEQVRASSDGDLQRAEAMLTTQAHTLDAIFNNLAQRAINAEYVDTLDSYLKLALRAQSQCRATWESLASIKNPPVMGYVRQANISHGPQQVNNAQNLRGLHPQSGENHNPLNEQLETKDGERLDTRTSCSTSEDDSELATMGEIDRPKDRER